MMMRLMLLVAALLIGMSGANAEAAQFVTEFKESFKNKLQGVINAQGFECHQVTHVKEEENEVGVFPVHYYVSCSNGDRFEIKTEDSRSFEFLKRCSKFNNCE